MKKLIFVFACFVLAFQFVHAQPDFRDGYIITDQHDTVYLKVDYRSNAKNYEQCRAGDGKDIKEYGPADVLGYGFVDDKYFESGIVKGSFAEVLVRGELNLYRQGAVFYVTKGDLQYQLERKEIHKEVAGRTVIKEDTKWKGLLGYLISDCLSANTELKRLRFSERPITELVARYNACRQSPYTVYKTKKQWTRSEVGIVFGMNRSTLAVDKALLFSRQPNQYHSTYFSIGISAAFWSPKLSERLAFQPEVHLSAADYSSLIVEPNAFSTTYYEARCEVTTISMPLMLCYSFPGKKYSVKLNAGLNFDRQIKSSTRNVRELVQSQSGAVFTESGQMFPVSKNQIGYVGGVGIIRSFSKFGVGLHFRYTASDLFCEIPNMHVRHEKLSLSLALQKQ